MAEFFANADVGFNLTVKDEGTTLGNFSTMNFIGAGVTSTDAGSGQTDVTIPGGGGGGPDTYTAPEEYYVDPLLAVDATKRQYQTIAAAVAAGVAATYNPITIRLANGRDHDWDGTSLPSGSTNIIIYGNSPADSDTAPWLNFLTGTWSTEGTLTFSGLYLACDSGVNLGAYYLNFDNCRGELLFNTTETPFASIPDIYIRNCQLGLGIAVPLTETTGGSLYVYDSLVSFGVATSYMIQHDTASSAFWYAEFEKSLIYAFDSVSTWIDSTTTGGGVDVDVRDSTFIVQGFGFGTLTLKDQGDGIRWYTSRIIIDESNKPGDEFQFGSAGTTEGTQSGLEIEFYSSFAGAPVLPLDAPQGTTARGATVPEDTQLVWQAGNTLQWRGPNGRTWLEGSTGGIPGIGVPVIIETVVEGDNLVRLGPSIVGTQYRTQGTIMIEGGAFFTVDAIMRADSSPSTAVFLSGQVPTLIYEDNPGQFTVSLTPVTGTEEGFQVTVTKNFGSVNAGISAQFNITEDVQ